jgi:hypothetical protein
MAQKQVVFDGIADRIATHLRQSIANSTGARTYSLRQHKRPAWEEAAAGVTIHRRGQKFPLWSYWVKCTNSINNSISIGSTRESMFGAAHKIDPDRVVKKGIESAEMKIARDLEANGAVGCGASVVVVVGFATVLSHFV